MQHHAGWVVNPIRYYSTQILKKPSANQVIRAEVPKVQYRSEFNLQPVTETPTTPAFETARFTKLNLLRDYNVDLFSTKLLNANFTEVQNEILCHDDFCCTFTINRVFIAQSSLHSAYRYRLTSYYGNQTTFQGRDPSTMAQCSIIACTSDALYSCGHIFPANVQVGNTHYFSKIEISGAFPKAERRLLMPSTVDGQMMPLAVNAYEMLQTDNDTSTLVSMKLKSPKADLLTFGILGNYFNPRTVTHNLRPTTMKTSNTKSAADKLYTSFFFVILAYVITKHF